ncbi:MAG: hypothetical protein ACKV22_00235 [Bryobacteraceae bacterium]
MEVRLSLDDKLVEEVRRIAEERATTLSGLIRDHLEAHVVESAASDRRLEERSALEQSFERFQFRVGKEARERADLYIRS